MNVKVENSYYVENPEGMELALIERDAPWSVIRHMNVTERKLALIKLIRLIPADSTH